MTAAFLHPLALPVIILGGLVLLIWLIGVAERAAIAWENRRFERAMAEYRARSVRFENSKASRRR